MEIIIFQNTNKSFYSEKYVDSIRSTLMPNLNNRKNILHLEWTNYCNETEKFPITPEVEEIKKTE